LHVSTTYSVTKHSDVVISGMQYVLFTIHIIIAVLTMCKLTLSSMSLTLKKTISYLDTEHFPVWCSLL